VQVELSPLVNAFANLIQNLNDASRYLQLRGTYDWRQDTQFMAGSTCRLAKPAASMAVFRPRCRGRPLPGRSIYLRAAYYF